MIEQAKKLAGWHKNIVVKIPVGEEGLKAIKKLGELGIKTNCTLVFSANQALLAALAGATFVSPFLGRIDDMGNDGMRALAEIVGIYDVYGFETKIIAASIRHPMHVVEAALLGTDIATVPFEVLERMIKHPLTDIGLKKFLEDAEKAKIEL
jgi:transaldolase